MCVRVSVCLSVSVRAGIKGIKQAYERYLQPQCDKNVRVASAKLTALDFEKLPRSKDWLRIFHM